MDDLYGYPWRWVTDGTVKTELPQGISVIDLSEQPETEGVAALWMQRHGVNAALVRPDNYVFASAAHAADAELLFENWRAHLN